MIRYIFSTLFLGFFLFYGFLTLIYISPTNQFNISLTKQMNLFDEILYQKWNFFAPPPKNNNRLYFIYNNNEIVLEVLKPIVENKIKNIPFNTDEEIIDYTISNSIFYINDVIIKVRELYKYECTFKNKTFNNYELTKRTNEKIKKTGAYKTLINYSKLVAKNNNIKLKNKKTIIIISNIEIPKFIDRNKKTNNKETIIFNSRT